MYAEFYKLTGKPFQLSPNPRFFFASEGHQKALAYLRYGLHQGEGFVVLTGDVGTGKTTLLGHLIDQLDTDEYLAAKLVTTQVGADDTLRLVASAFGIEASGVDKASLLREFERFLLENQRRGRRVLMLVDEVQNLPVNSLEELRMLSNFQSTEIAPIQFCLLGQPQFQQILASEDLMQLRQRVIASYHLGPIGVEETRSYIEHRMRLVGWEADPVISDGAFKLIHRYSSGVPRKINTLCDRLLLYGMLEDRHRIDEQVVEDVSAEMLREGTRTATDFNGKSAAHVALPAAEQAQASDVAHLEARIAKLERMVQGHDKTLRRAIALAANYFNSRGDKHDMPGDEGLE